MNLVVQGSIPASGALDTLVSLVGARNLIPLPAHGFRLCGARQHPGIPAWCAAQQMDCAWVPDTRRLADVRLVALDMDSTLITIESIDEMGDRLGIRDAVQTITDRAMRGEIEYAESLRQRVALLRGLDESALEDILASRVTLSPGAERLIAACRERGIRTLLVSGGFSFFTERLCARLGIDYALSNALGIHDGKLTGEVSGAIVDGAAKARCLLETARALGAEAGQTVAIGDGANDIPMLRAAGVSVAYRSKPAVRAAATHTLDYSGLDGVLNLFM